MASKASPIGEAANNLARTTSTLSVQTLSACPVTSALEEALVLVARRGVAPKVEADLAGAVIVAGTGSDESKLPRDLAVCAQSVRSKLDFSSIRRYITSREAAVSGCGS